MSTADTLLLDAPVRAWLRRIDEILVDLPEHGSPDPAAHRRAAKVLSDLLAAEFTEPTPPGVETEELRLTGAAGPLRARRFRSAGSSGPLPTMLWLHGGGWIAGTIDEVLNESTTADRALRSAVQIVSLEYRLAPEHPFPAPVDDAVAALADLRARAGELGVDPARLGIGGNSAGATIAASAALRERDAGRRLHHQALEVLPATLRPLDGPSEQQRRASGMDSAELLAGIYRAGAPLAECSPLDAADHRGLAPALILAAEFDPLRNGAVAYARALEDAEVPVTLRIGAGHVHGSPGLTAWQGARDWRDVFVAEVAAAYASEHPHPNTEPRGRR